MVGTTQPTGPNRDRFRQARRRRAQRRRQLVGVPAVLIGLALIGFGAWMWMDGTRGGDDRPAPTVGGTVLDASTTTTTATATTTSMVMTTTGAETAPRVETPPALGRERSDDSGGLSSEPPPGG